MIERWILNSTHEEDVREVLESDDVESYGQDEDGLWFEGSISQIAKFTASLTQLDEDLAKDLANSMYGESGSLQGLIKVKIQYVFLPEPDDAE